jgi:hypothetical protein
VRYKHGLLVIALFSGVAFTYATPAYAQTSVSSVRHNLSAAVASKSSQLNRLTISSDEGKVLSYSSKGIAATPSPSPSTSAGSETDIDIATEVTGAATALAALAAIGTLIAQGRNRRKDQWQDWLFQTIQPLGDAERYRQWKIPLDAPWDLSAAADELKGIARKLDNSRFTIPLLRGAASEGNQTVDSLRLTAIAATNLAGHLSHAAYLSQYLRGGTRPDQEIYSTESDRNALSDALKSSDKDKELLVQRASESFDQLKHYASKVNRGTRKVLLEHALITNSDRKGLPTSSTPSPPSAPSLQPDPSNPWFTVGKLGAWTPIVGGTPVPTVNLIDSDHGLPIGLVLNPVTGVISGTPVPEDVGVWPIVLAAINDSGPPASLPVRLIVSAGDSAKSAS